MICLVQKESCSSTLNKRKLESLSSTSCAGTSNSFTRTSGKTISPVPKKQKVVLQIKNKNYTKTDSEQSIDTSDTSDSESLPPTTTNSNQNIDKTSTSHSTDAFPKAFRLNEKNVCIEVRLRPIFFLRIHQRLNIFYHYGLFFTGSQNSY